ncbi:MAG: DNA cytosine methyltransferase [Chlorobiaceae bacterium]|nr:DNA cytosine methyltransferase [Chlorobiaceae bacterium]
MNKSIAVIDLFAGPGGLGEGFSAFTRPELDRPFRIRLSIEKDYFAHRTLRLRSFFRQFSAKKAPEDYYRYLRGEIDFTALSKRYPCEMEAATQESWHAELGVTDQNAVDQRIATALGGANKWILIGGPPCQAYSLVGRSRNGGTNPDDARLYLYREYLRIIAMHSPAVFIMENVKGLLSSRINNELIFDKILSDLRCPTRAINNSPAIPSENEYNLFSLVNRSSETASGWKELDPRDFIIRSEEYGIPQTRHRVIVLGVRKNVSTSGVGVLTPSESQVTSEILKGLPHLRSGLSKVKDNGVAWRAALAQYPVHSKDSVSKLVWGVIGKMPHEECARGADFIGTPAGQMSADLSSWFIDDRICGVCNHSSRGHMAEDLHRYLFTACYAQINGRSPTLQEFPQELLPRHKNVSKAINGGYFEDRFRVQVGSRPSTTITSHIAKDGHYYIHPDPSQCRSLTVREAARLQTFPDNYFFEGPRTEQYKQVGNAVPPLLARQIAQIVFEVLHAG